MTYGSMPADPIGYGNAPSGRPAEAPPAVKNAVLLMYVRIVVSVIGVIVILTQRDALKEEVLKNDSSLSASEVDSAVTVALTIGIVFAAIFLVLYLLLAKQLLKGKNWARIVTWVIAGLGVLGLLSAFSGAATGLSMTVSVVGGLIDLAIIVLLIMANKTGWFRRA